MLGSYIKIAFRRLLKDRIFSLINILGLSIGLTAFFLIMLYVRFELSYDDFHENSEDIYRVATKVTLQDEVINHESNTYVGIVNALKESGEVRAITAVSPFDSNGAFLRFQDQFGSTVPLSNFRGLYADKSFFSVFSFPLLKGKSDEVLRRPYSAVISESFASAYFADDALGKVVELKDDDSSPKQLTITGVMKDIPSNSHIKFDLLINLPEEEGRFWDWTGHAYMLLNAQGVPHEIERRLNELAREKEGLKTDAGDYGQISTFQLQPLGNIHLFSNLDYEFERGGHSALVYSLMILAIIIVLIAWVNYINLSMALSTQRIREIGVRKVVGASRWALAFQVLTESALFNSISIAVAVVLAWTISPIFYQLLGVSMELTLFSDKMMWLAILAFLMLGTMVAGGYPAMMIASMYPVRALRGKSTGSSLYFRKALVVFQFSAAIVLMMITTVGYRQLSFMQSRQLGINIDQVLVVKALNFDKETWSDSSGGYVVDSVYEQKAVLFKNELRNYADIAHVASLSHLPGQMPVWGTEFKVEDIDAVKAHSVKAIGIDYDFISTFQAKLLAGRNFSREFPSDQGNEWKRAVLINEAASKLLGFKTPDEAVSRHMNTYWGADYEIVGVVNSFHQLSLKENLTPLYFILQPRALTYFAINFRGRDVTQTVEHVKASWCHHFRDYPFDYFFLDEYFNNQYQNEEKFGTVTGIFTALAIFIGCIGLFGLTSYAIIQRTKEIGIRKLLGASVFNVIGLFSRDLLKLIALASAIAIPLGYMGIIQWLDNYAYKISLVWWLFAAPMALIVGIAMLTVSLQTVRVALTNPVESLKHE